MNDFENKYIELSDGSKFSIDDKTSNIVWLDEDGFPPEEYRKLVDPTIGYLVTILNHDGSYTDHFFNRRIDGKEFIREVKKEIPKFDNDPSGMKSVLFGDVFEPKKIRSNGIVHFDR